jgi:hypothetical protein
LRDFIGSWIVGPIFPQFQFLSFEGKDLGNMGAGSFCGFKKADSDVTDLAIQLH